MPCSVCMYVQPSRSMALRSLLMCVSMVRLVGKNASPQTSRENHCLVHSVPGLEAREKSSWYSFFRSLTELPATSTRAAFRSM